MPKKSKFQRKREEKVEDKAVSLYKKGYSTRRVAEMLGDKGIERSHTWVHRVVKSKIDELSTD